LLGRLVRAGSKVGESAFRKTMPLQRWFAVGPQPRPVAAPAGAKIVCGTGKGRQQEKDKGTSKGAVHCVSPHKIKSTRKTTRSPGLSAQGLRVGRPRQRRKQRPPAIRTKRGVARPRLGRWHLVASRFSDHRWVCVQGLREFPSHLQATQP